MEKNPVAQHLHERGLEAVRDGDFLLAHNSFTAAIQLLNDIPEEISTIAQRADIARDQGFTYVRELTVSDTPTARGGLLTTGRSRLRAAEAIVTDLLEHEEVSNQDRAGLSANRGATRSLLGRTATVGALLPNASLTDEHLRQNQITEARNRYCLAHKDLREGNNGYYRVSNAMVAARHERLFGSKVTVARWLGRAMLGLTWTSFYDTDNYEAAARTFRTRLPHLRTHDRAVKSVFEHP